MRTIVATSVFAAALAAVVLADTATNPPTPAVAPPPASTTATAAPAPAHRTRMSFHRAKMAVVAQQLGLSDAQKVKLKDLRRQTASAVKAVRENGSLTGEAKAAQIKALRQSARDQMRAVLTDDQRAKLAEIRSHPRMLNARAMQRMRLGMLVRSLELTPDQMTGIRDIRAKTLAAVKPIREDASLSREAKQAKVREAVQGSRAQIRALLTPEQQAKLQHMRRRLLAPLGPLG